MGKTQQQKTMSKPCASYINQCVNCYYFFITEIELQYKKHKPIIYDRSMFLTLSVQPVRSSLHY